MTDPQTQPVAPDSLYPVIESFIERATPEEVAELFATLKEALTVLKGPKAELATKVQKGIAAAEELLGHLLQVRERLEGEREAGAVQPQPRRKSDR